MSDFKVLDTVDFIKVNPNMYCGTTYNPIHLFKEVIDNAIDLLLENKVTIIDINNTDSGSFTVIDNGPGFPRLQVKLPNGEFEDSIVASLTKPHSGTKFNVSTAQHGQNGVGTMVVNALSSEMHVYVRNFETKKTVFHYIFIDAKFIKCQEEVNSEYWSTKVNFIVNPKYFETVKINSNIILERLFLIKSVYPNCKIIYNNKEIPKLSFESFVREKLEINSEIPIFEIEENNCRLFFTYDTLSRQVPVVYGDINLNICEGTFTSSILTLIYNIINGYLGEEKLTKSDILGQLRVYVSLNVLNPRFDSQTKSRLVSNIGNYITQFKPKLLNTLTNKKYFLDHFNRILEEKAKNVAAKVLKGTKTRVSSGNPLKDCIKTPGKTLYIVEGESAGGTLVQIRDKKEEAIFPLTGKILNAIDKSIDKAVESKKIKYLLEAIGIDLTKKKQQNFRYENVRIIADADNDGHHIVTLCTIALLKYANNLIETNKVSIILPPLYGATKNKKFIPIYKFENVEKYRDEGYNITRFKGLGEMNPSQLKEIIQNPMEYIIKPPKDNEESEIIIRCLTDTNLKRAICKDSRFGLEKLLLSL